MIAPLDQAARTALLRIVPLSLWPEHVLARRRRLKRFLTRLEPVFHAAIEELDTLTPDADLEPELGFQEHPCMSAEALMWANYQAAHARPQLTGGDREVDVDEEPLLSASPALDQRRWASQDYGFELEAEHDGREPEEDAEPEETDEACEDEGADSDREPDVDAEPDTDCEPCSAAFVLDQTIGGPAHAYWLACAEVRRPGPAT